MTQADIFRIPETTNSCRRTEGDWKAKETKEKGDKDKHHSVESQLDQAGRELCQISSRPTPNHESGLSTTKLSSEIKLNHFSQLANLSWPWSLTDAAKSDSQYLNQMCWSTEASEICNAGSTRYQGWRSWIRETRGWKECCPFLRIWRRSDGLFCWQLFM